MDNATHTLTGLFLSRAGLNRLTPHATAILMISANLPDADIVSLAGGPVAYLHWHRHLTHSLVAAPFLALFCVFAVRLIRGPLPWMAAFAVALAGVASHLVLDLTNIYGVRLLLPFSSEWLHWDLTPVIDLAIWGVFLVCLAGPFLSNLLSSEMGASTRAKFPGRGFAFLALAFLVTYNLGRMVAHSRALGILESREYDGTAPLRVAAFPESENFLHWKAIAETDSSYYVFRLDLTRAFDPAAGEMARKLEPSPAIRAADATRPFQVMREFAIYPLYRSVPLADTEGGFRVELSDIRFAFLSTALLDRNLRVERSSFQFSGAPR